MMLAEDVRDRVPLAMLAAPPDNVLGSPRFEPVRVLGEGGGGIVYEVRVLSGIGVDAKALSGTAPTVALKVLRAELAPSERERRRFLEEAARMQRVEAVGLVKLLEAGLLPDGRPYLAMPLLDGETLAARLKRGPLPAETAVRHFGVLARAVHALHVAGMVHRDVKPENIMLSGQEPVLLDFGIARDIDDDTTTTTAEGRVRGTPAYMAPERFFGAAASVRSDVYELGVVLYTMLVGRLPWGSEKNVTDRLNPASPRDAGADVSRALATVILRALSTRPEMRPASAEELARDVAAAAADVTSSSRRTLDFAVESERESEKIRAIGNAATELAPASMASGRSVAKSAVDTMKTRPAGATPRSTVTYVAIACAIAAAGALGARAIGWGAQGAGGGAGTMSAVGMAAPTSCAVGETAVAVPSAGASAGASASASASARPAVKAIAATASVRAPVVKSAGTGSADPSRYFEDRR